MVARSKRTVRENPRSKSHRDDATAATTSKGRDGKKKKKLGTARSVTSKSIKTKSSKSTRTKSTSNTGKANALHKQKKQMPKIKSTGASSRLAGAPPRLATPKSKIMKGGVGSSKPPLPPKQTRHPKPNLQISTSVSSEEEMSANPLSPSSKSNGPNRFPSTPNRAERKPSAKGFQETFGPRPTPKPGAGDNASVIDSIAESGIADSESFDHTQYSFISENGTVFTIENEVTFAMFLTDVKGFLVDKTGKMIPTGPEMVEMVEKTKGMVPESVKDKLNHTAKVLDPRDISGRELLASAKDITIATKDVVIEETAGCATWSFASLLSGIGFVTAAATAKNEDAVVEDTLEETQEDNTDLVPEHPAAVAPGENLPVITPMTVEEQLPADTPMATYEPSDMPNEDGISTGEKHWEESPKNENEQYPPANEDFNEDDELDQVSIEISMNEKARRLLLAANENQQCNRSVHNSPSVASNGMSAMTEESNIDMKEALRQIKDLNAEIERLQKQGGQDNVALAEVLKQRSKTLCRSMAVASTLAAAKTGSIKKAAIQTTKAVGQASSSIAKSSKKGVGSALISTSKAIGSLGEKLAKNKSDRSSRKDDATYTTGDNSTLSSHSRSRSSRSSRSEKSAGSKEDGKQVVLVSAGSRMSYGSGRRTSDLHEV